jgi:predicted nucleic acid-binding protein
MLLAPSRSRARRGDALIAQSSMDAGVRLVTRDRDFATFAKAAGQRLLYRL